MDEILKIVLNKNKQRKLLSNADVKRICNIIIQLKNYDDFTVEFKKEGSSDLTAGACFSDSIEFYNNGIERFIEELYKDITANCVFDGNKIDVLNFFYLSIIFHEFAHVRQHRIVDFGYSSIEKRIYDMCFRMQNVDKFYDNNYLIFPCEVNAYNKGYIDAYNIYRRFPKNFLTANDKNNYLIYLTDYIADNYSVDAKKDTVTSPLEKFYIKANEFNVSLVGVDITKIKNIIESKQDITLYQKMMLGLPISFQEFGYINLIDDCIHAGQDIDIVKKMQKKL